jgi:pimeloyl-ACP methyl ester carboxylesterase
MMTVVQVRINTKRCVFVAAAEFEPVCSAMGFAGVGRIGPGAGGRAMRTRPPLGLALAIVLIGCGGAGSSATLGPTPAPYVADLAVDGDRALHIVCSGPTDSGRPTVVFENGGGQRFSTWSAVMSEIKATDRACAYDRAGLGMSDGAPEPRTTRDQVNDLATLLEKAGITGPIVLVAHSAGGWNAIVYTADHPEQVVGAVLVDVKPAALDGRWLEELPQEQPDEPDVIRELRVDLMTFRTDPSLNPENVLIADSEVEVLAAPGFGARPTEILWATNTDVTNWPGFDPDLAARLNAAFEEVRLDVEALADDPTVTRVDTGHFIHDERPELVLAAIRRVLDQLEP